MNWDAVGAVSQALGSLAVLVTLVYLAIQTRHSTAESRRSFFEAHHMGIFELVNDRAGDARRNQLFLKAHVGLDAEPPMFVRTLVERTGMSTEEALVVYWDMAADWMWRLQFIQNRERITVAERQEFEWPFITIYKCDPVGRLWWESVRRNQPSDVLRYVENLFTREIAEDHFFSDAKVRFASP